MKKIIKGLSVILALLFLLSLLTACEKNDTIQGAPDDSSAATTEESSSQSDAEQGGGTEQTDDNKPTGTSGDRYTQNY
ncbi:MAG: hypothetical protein IJV72_00465 [Clostridia bacterium]|nr:hypothetical protein [Clostridia bacterium]